MNNKRNYNKIFGIGLSKTATSSLAVALRQIGIPTIDYPRDPLTRAQLEAGDFKLKLLERYDAITDTPVVPYYPQLDELYPGSKFILTIRGIDSWLSSISSHWSRDSLEDMNESDRNFSYFIRAAVYGSISFDESRYRYVYEQHTRGVLEYFAHRRQDLLVLDIIGGQTMGALGDFLGINVPDEPFPRVNTNSDHHGWIAHRKRIREAFKTIDRIIPPEATVLWVDECKLIDFRERNARPSMTFPESAGIYQGPPADDERACAEIERHRERGAEYMVFVEDSMWWLEHYADLNSYLRSNYACQIDTPELKVFNLGSKVA